MPESLHVAFNLVKQWHSSCFFHQLVLHLVGFWEKQGQNIELENEKKQQHIKVQNNLHFGVKKHRATFFD